MKFKVPCELHCGHTLVQTACRTEESIDIDVKSDEVPSKVYISYMVYWGEWWAID